MRFDEYATLEQLEDNAPEWAEHTIALASWSRGNYDYRRSPYLLFLDLIGYSEEEYGQNFITDHSKVLGYLEMDYLADALKEYAKRPLDITDLIGKHAELEIGSNE